MEQCKPVTTSLEDGKHFQKVAEENPTNINIYQNSYDVGLTYATMQQLVQIYPRMSKPSKEVLEWSKKSPEVYQRYCYLQSSL